MNEINIAGSIIYTLLKMPVCNSGSEGRRCGTFGDTGCFSFHPLKNLNVWGDGGIVTTSDSRLAERLRLIRNHGLVNRDTCVEFSYNSRLDTLQAVVAKHVIQTNENITNMRIRNACCLIHCSKK